MRFFQRKASAEKAARGPLYLASAPGADFTGRYLEGEKVKAVPSRLRNVELQERVWRLGESLTRLAVGTEGVETPAHREAWIRR